VATTQCHPMDERVNYGQSYVIKYYSAITRHKEVVFFTTWMNLENVY
jgi:hypothetical protein